MKTAIYIVLILLVFIFPTFNASAAESQDLRKQRRMAHDERMAKKNQRHAELAKAKKNFNSFVRDLKAEYDPKLNDLDKEFKLKRVKLAADAKAKRAEIDADNHKAMLLHSLNPDKPLDMKTIEKKNAESDSFGGKVYALEKAHAKSLHEESIANEKRKNALLKQRDQLALDKAEALGLLHQYTPILATPIGGQLTRHEKKWNEQEKKNTERINKKNLAIVQKFKCGEKIREWKIQNMMADFELERLEKEERHRIDSEVSLYNTKLYFGENIDKAKQQEYLSKLAELEKKKELIRIKYEEIRERNMIMRREEEKRMRFE